MKKLKKIKIKTVNISVFALIGVFALGYLVQINSLATKGYQIGELEVRVGDIKQQNGQLESKTLELQSMDNVKSKVANLGMVPVGASDYLSAVDNFVATNR